MGVPFYNCPTLGKDVVVIDQIIGGPEYAGKGWQMLMECLAVGRSISLPAQSTGGTKMVARVAGAYASIRKQFGIEIGKFEGIEEPLARIGGFSYLLKQVVSLPLVLSIAVSNHQLSLPLQSTTPELFEKRSTMVWTFSVVLRFLAFFVTF